MSFKISNYKLQFNEPDIKGPIAQPSNTATSFVYVVLAFSFLNYDRVMFALVLFLSITTIYFHARDTLFGQWLDIFSILVLALFMLSKAYPFNNLVSGNFFIAMSLILVGWVFWIIDIKKILIPKNHILTGHGIWHFLTAAAIWFLYWSLPFH